MIEAPTGAEALNLLADPDQGIDLLLSDYAMPQLSGPDIVAMGREFRPNLPALLITGYVDTDEIRERREDVAIPSKPFTLTKLVSAIYKPFNIATASFAYMPNMKIVLTA